MAGLCLVPAPRMGAQPAAPQSFTSGDIDREQRLITADLEDTVAQLHEGLLRAGAERFDDATATGMRALQGLLESAKLIDSHPVHIEEMRGLFFPESARADYRATYQGVLRPKYFQVEKDVGDFAKTLQKHGYSAVLVALGKVQTWMNTSDPAARKQAEDDFNKVVQQFSDPSKNHSDADSGNSDVLNKVAPGTIKPGADAGGAGPTGAGPAGAGTGVAATVGGAAGPAPVAIAGIPGATATQSDPNQVTLNLPGTNPLSLRGVLSADGRYLDSPDYGRIDLSSGQKRADGSRAFQSDKGVLVINPDGTVHFIPGGKLAADGGITNASGGPMSPADVARYDPTGKAAPFSGTLPAGTVVLDQNGNRITVDPTWQNGEQTGVKKDYVGGVGATLVGETKVTRRLTQAEGSEWRVNVVAGESRAWSLSIKMGAQQTVNGSVQLVLTVVDGGGSGAFTIDAWDIADDQGDRATVVPDPANPAAASATFTKGGDYNFTVTGKTDWGSAFRVKGRGGVYP